MFVQLPTEDPARRRQLLLDAETLHRQLRPTLPAQDEEYMQLMETMFAEGARMALLFENNDDDGKDTTTNKPRTLAIFRIQTTTFHGKRLFVDDLVTDQNVRSNGWGTQMLNWLQSTAIQEGCEWFDLESGVQRSAAHGFYFRNGLTIKSFSFTKALLK